MNASHTSATLVCGRLHTWQISFEMRIFLFKVLRNACRIIRNLVVVPRPRKERRLRIKKCNVWVIPIFVFHNWLNYSHWLDKSLWICESQFLLIHITSIASVNYTPHDSCLALFFCLLKKWPGQRETSLIIVFGRPSIFSSMHIAHYMYLKSIMKMDKN